MKNFKLYLLLICCCFLCNNVLNAQKAKFKNQSVTVQKTKLPINYIDPAKRTYNLYAKGSYSSDINTHEKRIYGWTLDQDNPYLKGVVSIYGFSIGRVTKSSKARQSKSKDGKVTKWTEHTYTNSAQGRGTLYIYGESNPFKYKKKGAKKSKYELKKEAEAAAKKKELEDNPFLSSDDIKDAEESDVTEDAGLDGEELKLVKTMSLNNSTKVTTSARKSASAAYKEYTDVKRPQLYTFKSQYPNRAYYNAMKNMNNLYGYTPVKSRFSMKKMKSEKHAQYKKWNNACQATVTLFKSFKYNKSIEADQAKFNAIIDYFGAVVNTTPDTDRKAKNMKRSAFQNMTNILYYLDKHDEVIKLCNKNLSSKVLGKTSKRMLAKSEKLKAHLEFHKMTTCHMESSEEIETEEIEVDESEEDDTADDNK